MKWTIELDTLQEPDGTRTLDLINKAPAMAAALHELADMIREWYKYPHDNIPLNADTLREKFYDILLDNGLNLDNL